MTERCVVDEDVFSRDALVFQILLKDFVGCPRVDIVGTKKREFLNAEFFQIVIRCRDRLLVGGGACVEHVLRAFLALILDRIEQKAVQLFNDRQDRLA